MSEQGAAGIGHNRRGVTETWKEENETLAKRIAEDNAGLSERKTKLLEEAKGLPAAIRNDDQLGEVNDWIKRARTLGKDAEAIRVSTKAPVLEAGSIIDSLFNKFKRSLGDVADDLNARGTKYQLEKERKAREKLEAEAARAREEEDRLRREAEKAAKKKDTDKAIDAAEDAAAARAVRVEKEKAAEVAPAELTRTRGGMSVGSLVETWHGSVEDFDKVDLNGMRKYISRSEIEKAAERAAKDLEANGVGTIKGVKIYSTKEQRVA